MEKQELERLLAVSSLLKSDAGRIFALISQNREHLKTIDIHLQGGSMSPSIPRGSMIRVQLNHKGGYNPGQIVAFLHAGRIMAHRIHYCGSGKSAKHYFLTRGDATLLPDPPVLVQSLLGPVIAFQKDNEWVPPGPPLRAYRLMLSSFWLRCIGFILEINVSAAIWLTKLGRTDESTAGVSLAPPILRSATKLDLDHLAHLDIETQRSTYKTILPESHLLKLSFTDARNKWEARLQDSQTFILVAEDAGHKLIGYVYGGPARKPEPAHAGEIYAIYILPSHQRAGLGRRLMRSAAEELAQRGMHSFLIWVLAANPSRKFYEALGGIYLRSAPNQLGDLVQEGISYGWKDMAALRCDSH